MDGAGGDRGGSRRSQLSVAEDDDDVAVLVEGQWVNTAGDKHVAFSIGVEDVSSNSIPSPSSSDCLLIDSNKKRKEVASSKVPAKKRHMADNKVSSCSVSQRDYELVENSSSILTKDEVAHLFVTYNISFTDYEFLVPSKDQRANKPPEGYISVYEKQIEAGLRFPLHDLVIQVCNLMRVSPGQLVPNAHCIIVGFILCAKFYNIPVTPNYFFSLFKVRSVSGMELFYFHPQQFLKNKPSSAPWKSKFFFLRPRGKPWNCLTKWSEKYQKPMYDSALAESALELGIMDHHFWVNKLTCKEILVHGGIEPGVPSPRLTFKYLMHEAAVTKFELLPEDRPSPACGTTEVAKVATKSPLPAAPPSSAVAPATLSASTSNETQAAIPSLKIGTCPNTSATTTAGAASSAQLSSKHPRGMECVHDKFSPSSEDTIPLKELFGKEKEDQISKSFVSHIKKGKPSAVSIADDQTPPPQALPPHLLAMSQVLDSVFVPKECYQKLEMKQEELTLALAFTKSYVQELEKELELSKAKKADLCDKIRREAIKEFKSSDEFLNSCDEIRKDAIEEFKCSDEFFTAVQDEAHKFYVIGFETCRKQFLNLGKLSKGFNLEFLNITADEWGKSSRTTADVSIKSIKPER